MELSTSQLTEAKIRRYRTCLVRLKAEGHDLKIPGQWLDNKEVLEIQAGEPGENMLLDLGGGCVGYYAVWIRMIPKRSQVTLLDYEITSDCDDQIELIDVDRSDQTWLLRCFGLNSKQVLNARFERSLAFHQRGRVIEGWLVAAGSRPVPDACGAGAIVGCQLIFQDQFAVESRVQTNLFLRRLPWRQSAIVPPGAGTGLNETDQELSVAEESRRYSETIARERVKLTNGSSLKSKAPLRFEESIDKHFEVAFSQDGRERRRSEDLPQAISARK